MDFSESGPIDIFMLRFPGTRFRSVMVTGLRDLAATGVVRVIDLLFVFRTADGEVGWIELDGLGPDLAPLADLDGHLGGGLLDAEDVTEVSPMLGPESSIVVVVVENLWAVPFITGVREAGGEVVDRARMTPVFRPRPDGAVPGPTREQ